MKTLLLITVLSLSLFGSAQSDKDKHSVLYNDAVKMIGNQNYEQAISLLDKAIALHPQFAEAVFARGTSFLMLNKREEACNDFEMALALNHWEAEDYLKKYCSKKSK